MREQTKKIPCTKQIAKDLEQKIREGILRPGMKLSSVRDLAKEYNTCTSVCLSVYKNLEKKGLVQRESGRGTFVSKTLPPEANQYVTTWNWIFPYGKITQLLDSVFQQNGMENWRQNPFYTDQYSGGPDYIHFAGINAAHPGTFAVDEGIFPAFAEQNTLYPLDKLLDESKVLSRSDFPSKLLETFSYHGKLYAIPFSFSPFVLLYNKRLFRRANLPEPVKEWKWEDLYRNTELLTSYSSELKRIRQYGLGILFTVNSYVPFILQNGGALFDPNGNCVINSDETFEALNFFTELYALPGVCSHKFGDSRSALADLMANDLMAMMISDVVDYKLLKEKMPEDDFGVVPLPARKMSRTSLSCLGWAIHRGCRSPEAHFHFLENLYSMPEMSVHLNEYHCGFQAFRPEKNGVPELFRNILSSAYPSMTSPSPDALRLITETLTPFLNHKMVISRDRTEAFEQKINISL